MGVVGGAALHIINGFGGGTAAAAGGYGNCKCKATTMEIRWVGKTSRRIPVYISTNPSHINPQQLLQLYTSCNHSSHRFPKVNHNGRLVEALDLNKLSTALSHSFIVVSVFCNYSLPEDEDEDDGVVVVDGNYENQTKEKEGGAPSPPLMGLGDLFQRIVPLPPPLLSPSNAHLVGFGRAVSDHGLTASIYDVMVIPSLRGMGIGKMIVKRIIRMLTSRDIYDIAALCSPNERLFFKACGFGDDILGSTTMMYGKTVSNDNEGNEMVRCAGRKLLLAPPLRDL